MKAALRIPGNPLSSTEVLPLVVLGIRTALKCDLGCRTVAMLYGIVIRVLG